MSQNEMLVKLQEILGVELNNDVGLVSYIQKKDFLDKIAKQLENDDTATFLNSCHFRGIDFILAHHLQNVDEEISVILAALNKLIQYKPIVKEKRISTAFESMLNNEKNYLRELRRNLNQLDNEHPKNPLRLSCKHMIRNHYELYKALKEMEELTDLPAIFRSFMNPKTKNIYANYILYLNEQRSTLSKSISYFEIPLKRFEVYSDNMQELHFDTKNSQFLALSKELCNFNSKIQSIKPKKSKTKETELEKLKQKDPAFLIDEKFLNVDSAKSRVPSSIQQKFAKVGSAKSKEPFPIGDKVLNVGIAMDDKPSVIDEPFKDEKYQTTAEFSENDLEDSAVEITDTKSNAGDDLDSPLNENQQTTVPLTNRSDNSIDKQVDDPPNPQRIVNDCYDLKIYGDFIVQGAVWEVLNGNLIKERTLYLYDKALVVAKDLNDGTEAFEVRSCLNLECFKIKADRNTRRVALRLKQNIIDSVTLFNKSPDLGLKLMLSGKKLEQTSMDRNICSFLHKTPGIDKHTVAEYLCDNERLFKCFMDWFDTTLSGLRMDLALRLLLSQVYLPLDESKSTKILNQFTLAFVKFNPNVFGSSENVSKVFSSFLAFDSELDWTFDKFSEALSCSKGAIKSDMIEKIFNDLQENALFMNEEENHKMKLAFDITMIPEYLVMDDIAKVSITIPTVDSYLSLLVCGQDMIINPTVLRFDKSNKCDFTILPSRSGRNKIYFVPYGASANLYKIIAPQTISIERDFMKYTLLLKGIREAKDCKFLFAVATKSQKALWIKNLSECGLKFK